jgi:hypothetical protein
MSPLGTGACSRSPGVYGEVTVGSPLTYFIAGVTQGEPAVDKGDLATPDARRSAGDRVELRAEFNPRGDGRVRRVAYNVSVRRGGACRGTVRVGVPRTTTQSAVESPPTYSSSG